jgi:tripartite-type tricarboxylate transporter receptor subunit TctC
MTTVKRFLRLTCLVSLCAALGLVSSPLGAQSYPNGRITIFTSFPPGGGTDFLARVVAQHLGEKWGQPVVVESRVGGNGIIGARAAAKATPDGYTLYVGSSNHIVLLPAMYYDNPPFDPLKDFVPVIPIGSQHVALVVHPSLPANSVAEFVAYVRSKPGQLNYAAVGIGGLEHLVATLMQSRTGTQMMHIPYKSGGAAVGAVLSGDDVSMMFASLVSVMPHIKAGRLRALAVTAPNRSPAMPNVPTASESGLGDFVVFTWNGLFVPAGTPPELVKKLHGEVADMLARPEVRQRLVTAGVDPMGGSAEDFTALINAEIQRWTKVIKDSGLERPKLN